MPDKDDLFTFETEPAAPKAAPRPFSGKTPRVTSGFDAPRDGGRRTHHATDYAFGEGDPVAVNRPGRVTKIGEDSRAGKHLFIDHGDGYTSSYSHLSEIDVEEGDEVEPGVTFARAGHTGEGTGPHLHHVVRRAGARVNPEQSGIRPVRGERPFERNYLKFETETDEPEAGLQFETSPTQAPPPQTPDDRAAAEGTTGTRSGQPEGHTIPPATPTTRATPGDFVTPAINSFAAYESTGRLTNPPQEHSPADFVRPNRDYEFEKPVVAAPTPRAVRPAARRPARAGRQTAAPTQSPQPEAPRPQQQPAPRGGAPAPFDAARLAPMTPDQASEEYLRHFGRQMGLESKYLDEFVRRAVSEGGVGFNYADTNTPVSREDFEALRATGFEGVNVRPGVRALAQNLSEQAEADARAALESSLRRDAEQAFMRASAPVTAEGDAAPRPAVEHDRFVEDYVRGQVDELVRAQGSARAELERRARVAGLSWPEYAARLGAEAARGARDVVSDTFRGGAVLEEAGVMASPIISLLAEAGAYLDAKATGKEFRSSLTPGTAADRRALFAVGDSIQQALGEDRDLAPEFAAKVARGGGSSVPFFVLGAVTGGAEWASGLLGAVSQAGGAYQEATEKGLTGGRRLAVALANLPIGATEMFGVGGTFNRVTGGEFTRSFARFLHDTGREATEEALQEFFQTAAGEMLMNTAVERDPKVAEALQKALDAAGQAAVVGGLFGGGTSAVEQVAGGHEHDAADTTPADTVSIDGVSAETSPASSGAQNQATPARKAGGVRPAAVYESLRDQFRAATEPDNPRVGVLAAPGETLSVVPAEFTSVAFRGSDGAEGTLYLNTQKLRKMGLDAPERLRDYLTEHGLDPFLRGGDPGRGDADALPRAEATPVTEAPETLKTRLEDLKAGRRAVAAATKEEAESEGFKVPAGMRSFKDFDGGRVVYDPNQVSREEVVAAWDAGRLDSLNEEKRNGDDQGGGNLGGVAEAAGHRLGEQAAVEEAAREEAEAQPAAEVSVNGHRAEGEGTGGGTVLERGADARRGEDEQAERAAPARPVAVGEHGSARLPDGSDQGGAEAATKSARSLRPAEREADGTIKQQGIMPEAEYQEYLEQNAFKPAPADAHHSNYQPRDEAGAFVEGKPAIPRTPEEHAPLAKSLREKLEEAARQEEEKRRVQSPGNSDISPAPADSHEEIRRAVESADASAEPTFRTFPEGMGDSRIPRARMPQIKSEHRGAMVQFLKGRGISHEQVEVAPDTLKPSQADWSPEKVAKATGFTGPDRSILISSDGHVADGHHQWLAKLVSDPTQPIPAIRLDAPIHQLLVEMARFPSSGVDDASAAPKGEEKTSPPSNPDTQKRDTPAKTEQGPEGRRVRVGKREGVIVRAYTSTNGVESYDILFDGKSEPTPVRRANAQIIEEGGEVGADSPQAVTPQAEADAAAPPAKPSLTDQFSPEARAALDRLKKRFNTPTTDQTRLSEIGFGNDDLIDAAIVGAELVKIGARRAADWGRQMLDLIGEAVRPYLGRIYDATLVELESEGHDTTDLAEEFDDNSIDLLPREEDNTTHESTSPHGQRRVPAAQGAGVGSESRPVGQEGDRASEPDESGAPLRDGGGGDAGGVGDSSAGGRQEQVRPARRGGDGTRDGERTGEGRASSPDDVETGRRKRAAREGLDATHQTAPALSSNYRITDPDAHGVFTPVVKYNNNMAAYRLVKQLDEEGRQATPEEQEILAKWTGWGSLPQAFHPWDKRFTPSDDASAWSRRAAELRELLGAKEYESLRASTLNAHYTSGRVVEAMWRMVGRLGFKGGRVLEPSVGSGNFFGLMPAGLKNKATSLYGVELDIITVAVARHLYPAAKVEQAGFEDVAFPDNFFDLAISNVPFGDFKPYDKLEKQRNKLGANIHDYFFLKSVDKVREGGLVAFITSTGTMDKLDPTVRRALAKKAELVASMRLPEGIFGANAGTQVVTDIVILKKRKTAATRINELRVELAEANSRLGAAIGTAEEMERLYRLDSDEKTAEALGAAHRHVEHYSGVKERLDAEIGELQAGKKEADDLTWIDAVPALTPAGEPLVNQKGEQVGINEYYNKHPEQILGTLDTNSRLYGKGSVHVTKTDDFEGLFERAIGRLPRDAYEPYRDTGREFVPEVLPAPGHVKEGGYVVRGKKLFQREGGGLVEREAPDKEREVIEGHLNVRDALRALLLAEDEGQPHKVGAARKELGARYDAFVKKHGPLHKSTNARAFADDPDSNVLLGLEEWDAAAKKARKSPIFTESTTRRYERPSSADSPAAAAAISLNETAGISLPRVAELLGTTEDEAARRLLDERVVFRDPAAGLVPRDEYLTGNVRRKLHEAREALKVSDEYAENVRALEEVQPADVDHEEIEVQLGAGWVPPSDMADFFASLAGGSPEDFRIAYSPTNGWTFRYSNDGERKHRRGNADVQLWGTPYVPMMKVAEAAAKNKPLVVTEKDDDGKTYVLQKETEEANAKVAAMRERFGEWVWEGAERRKRLHRFYNDNMNNTVPYEPRHPVYALGDEGARHAFPGMAREVGGKPFSMRPHQANAAWMTVTKGTALYAHEVGTGKTYTMAAAAMELKRLGLAKKPAIIVPRSRIDATVAEIQELYPNARILATGSKFSGRQRKRTIARMALGSYDIVVMTHPNIDGLPMRPETEEKFIREELAELDEVLHWLQANTEKNDRAGKSMIKRMEKARKRLVARIAKALGDARSDDAVYFEETGIDALFVDEAHFYKALPVYTQMQNVGGIPTRRSQRATRMFMRARWLQERQGGRGVVFATGTPIANTMVEFYTMQKYLQYDELYQRGIHTFDAWAAAFGRVVSRMETLVTGAEKVKQRFSEFINLPELVQLSRQVMDVKFASEMPDITRPEGKIEAVTTPQSALQAGFQAEIQRRAKALRGPAVKGGDNMLRISSDARKAAVDMRLVFEGAADDPDSKLNVMVRRVLAEFNENPAATQMIFSDIGVNPTKKKREADDEGADDEIVVVAGEDEDGDSDEAADSDFEVTTGFSLYDDIIRKLVAGGIPRDKIINFSKLSDREREGASRRLKDGDALVGIGSTGTLGTGVNAQDHLVALHHLDAPWMPAEVEQRDGRGVRQGNRNKQVRVYRYITLKSFDQFLWETLDRKAKFIRQAMKGDLKVRRVQDDDEGDLMMDAGAMAAIASGNPHALQKRSLAKQVEDLEKAEARHRRGQQSMGALLAENRRDLERLEKAAADVAADAARAASLKAADFEIKIGGRVYADRREASKAMRDRVFDLARRSMGGYSATAETVGEYKGFKLEVSVYRGGTPNAQIRGAGSYDYNVSTESLTEGGDGGLRSVDAVIANLQKRAEAAASKVEQLKKNIAATEAELGQPFKKAAQLEEKREKLKEVTQLYREAAGIKDLFPAGSPELDAELFARKLAEQDAESSRGGAGLRDDLRTPEAYFNFQKEHFRQAADSGAADPVQEFNLEYNAAETGRWLGRHAENYLKAAIRRINGEAEPGAVGDAGGSATTPGFIPTPEEAAVLKRKIMRQLKSLLSGNTLASGMYPAHVVAELLPDLARLGAYHIKNGAAEFKAFAGRMVDDLGDGIEPHLRKIYKEAKKLIEGEHEQTSDAVRGTDGRVDGIITRPGNQAHGDDVSGDDDGTRDGGAADGVARPVPQSDAAGVTGRTPANGASAELAGVEGGQGDVRENLRPARRPGVRSFPETLEAADLEGGDDRTYQVYTNSAALEDADALIEEKGVDGAIEYLRNSEDVGAEHVALAYRLLSRLDGEKAVRVASDISRKLTRAGQAVQAAQIVSRLAPERVAVVASRIAEDAGVRLSAEKLDEIKSLAAAAQQSDARARDLEAKVADALRKATEAGAEAARLEGELDRLRRQLHRALEAEERNEDLERKVANLQAQVRRLKDERQATRKARTTAVGVRASALSRRLSALEAEARARLEARKGGGAAANFTVKGKDTSRRDGGSQSGASAVPLDIADWAIIGAAKLARTGLDFAGWAAEMLADIGEEVRPHLRLVYHRSLQTLQQERDALRRERRERAGLRRAVEEGIDPDAVEADELARLIADAEEAASERARRAQELARALAAIEPKGLGRRIFDAATDAANAPRSLMSSGDMPPVLRQGLLLSLMHPRTAAGAFWRATAAGMRGKTYDDIVREIKAHPRFREMRGAKLYLATVAEERSEGLGDIAALAAREEQFSSRLVAKLPWVKFSSRNFNAFADLLRVHAYTAFAEYLESHDLTAREDRRHFEAAASFVNVTSGRGTLGERIDAAFPFLSLFGFSPRFTVARAETPFIPLTYPPRVMAHSYWQLGKAGVALGVSMALLSLVPGVHIQWWPPDDSDWLRVKVGDYRWDLLGGMQSPYRFVYRVAAGVVAQRQGRKLERGEKPGEIILNFARQKASPQASYVWDLVTNETLDYDDKTGKREPFEWFGHFLDSQGRFNPGNGIVGRVLPMSPRDVYRSYLKDGAAGALAASPSMVGAGFNNYHEAQRVELTGKAAEVFAELEKTPDAAPSRLVVGGRARELTAGQRAALEADVRREVNRRVEEFFAPVKEAGRAALDRYETGTPEQKKKILNGIQSDAAEAVRARFKKEYAAAHKSEVAAEKASERERARAQRAELVERKAARGAITPEEAARAVERLRGGAKRP